MLGRPIREVHIAMQLQRFVTNPGSDQFWSSKSRHYSHPMLINGPDLLGRPIREVHIDAMTMLGVADPDADSVSNSVTGRNLMAEFL